MSWLTGGIVVGVRAVFGGHEGPQGGQAVPDRPGQQGSGGAPGHGGPPRQASVQERRLVQEGDGRRVPGSGLQEPTGAISPERVPEEVPSMVRGGAPGKKVLGSSFAPLAQWAGREGTWETRKVHRWAGGG